MSGPERTEAAPPAGGADVLDAVTHAIATLESHPDPGVREAAATALAGIDAVHRAGLTHLVQAVHGMAGEAFLNRLLADPAIRLLLMSYNLIAVDRRLQAEEALDAVRGHLHEHGIDVALLDVVGGVVTVRLHTSRRAAAGEHALHRDDARRDIEAALREGLLGFQELVVEDGVPAPRAATIPLDGLRRARRPVYVDAGPADLAPGTLRAATVGGVPVLLAAVEGTILAVRNRCGDSPLPLEYGTLRETELHCSWHGCRYDVRTGHRLDGQGDRLAVYPVAVEHGRVRVALDVEAAAGDR